MTTTDLVENDLRQILANAPDGNYLAAYDQIVDTVDTQGRTGAIVNRKARVERFKDAVARLDRKGLAEANKTFKGYLKQVRANASLAVDGPRQLTTTEAKSLMEEALSLQQARDVLTARWETIKEHVFGHMDEQFAEEGEAYPEHVNGSLDVEDLGYRFAREGAGRKEPSLQESVLRKLVGEEVWANIVDRKTIVVEEVNVGKLMAQAAKNPALLEDLRKSLKVGEWKSPRLNVRDL